MNIGSVVDVTVLLTTFATLIVILDPMGLMPVFLALTSKFSPKAQRKAAVQASLVSFGVILLSWGSRFFELCRSRWSP